MSEDRERQEAPPKLLADCDQLRAEVANLVAMVRKHNAEECTMPPGMCPGLAAMTRIIQLGRSGHMHPIDLATVAVLVLDEREQELKRLRGEVDG